MKLQRTHMASRKILLNCFIARNVKSLPEDTVQMKHMAAIKKKPLMNSKICFLWELSHKQQSCILLELYIQIDTWFFYSHKNLMNTYFVPDDTDSLHEVIFFFPQAQKCAFLVAQW